MARIVKNEVFDDYLVIVSGNRVIGRAKKKADAQVIAKGFERLEKIGRRRK